MLVQFGENDPCPVSFRNQVYRRGICFLPERQERPEQVALDIRAWPARPQLWHHQRMTATGKTILIAVVSFVLGHISCAIMHHLLHASR